LELGKTAQDAPDVWCYLRESVVKSGQRGHPVKNFERWLYQRDAEGARTLATEKVDVPTQMFEFDRNHLYDLTARQTQRAMGQTMIRFGVLVRDNPKDAAACGQPCAGECRRLYCLKQGRR
jgi:hypothetical protein